MTYIVEKTFNLQEDRLTSIREYIEIRKTLLVLGVLLLTACGSEDEEKEVKSVETNQ